MSSNQGPAVADLLALYGLKRSKAGPRESVDSLAQRVAEEDTAALAAQALRTLRAAAAREGTTLPDGWSVSVKVRLTTRSNGNLGRTTTNYYISPSGKMFRSHAAVIAALRSQASIPSSHAASEEPAASAFVSCPPSDLSSGESDSEPCAKRIRL
ncbi:hypothetical protein HYH03_000542 [Edaphochlamys debaryana]|uniref:MBD domain-containing protein n=1 Tax=Edaphochlamys debaryana TaxID=47281 RepID=A0A836C7A5_9CHLO|nr:hypothetical protein HYH03_000542 [Edaphochlamys debaryana]|eukprot:KAG2502048.1 hypothetical protein HYH03_000542 [Edaphochlamys debaryana]